MRRAATSPRLPSVIIFSTCGRMALALAGVVSMRSSMMSEVTRLRSSARRWLVLRPNFFVAMRWRMGCVLCEAASYWLLAASLRTVADSVFSTWYLVLGKTKSPNSQTHSINWIGETRSPDHPMIRSPDLSEFLSFAVTGNRHRWWRQLAGRTGNSVTLFVDPHAQREAHGGQDFLDLIQRLAAEILGLQHFGFGLLHQLADGLDVRVLEAVVAAHGKLQLFHRTIQVFILDPRLVFAAGFCLQLLFK